MVTENLKYNVGSMENQSNRVKKTGNPLKNAKSLVAVIQRILKELMCEDATTVRIIAFFLTSLVSSKSISFDDYFKCLEQTKRQHRGGNLETGW